MATAETIAKTLGGRKAGGSWMARCPAHREPSLSIRDADDGKVLMRGHYGFEQERVVAALRSRGLWEDKSHRRLTRSAKVGSRPPTAIARVERPRNTS